MLNPILNFSFCKGLPLYHFQEKGESLPASYAMAWCMTATSVYRIFTKDDMREFLFRLAITLHSMDLLEIWLMKDRLMTYTVNDEEYVFTLNDIIMHFGLELFDAYINLSSREQYLDNVVSGMMGAMLMGAMEGFSIVEPEITEDEEGKLLNFALVKESIPEISPNLITKAEFFAVDLMQFIPEEIFEHPKAEKTEKELELIERSERINHLPVFNIHKIPRRTIKECLETIYISEYAKKLLTDKQEFEKKAKPLIYLGWLYANGLLQNGDGGLEEREGILLDYKDYQLEDGGYNLNLTIERYNIEYVAPLLRGLFIG